MKDRPHARWGMDTSGLQSNPGLPTGGVYVALVDDEPAYEIVWPCACDAIEPQVANLNCSLLYYGSLGLRETRSRQTLEPLRACIPKTVLIDVNLRPPWWQREQLLDMLHTAHWVKLNTDELDLLYPSAKHVPLLAADFLSEYGLNRLVVTHGAQGAELLTDTGEYFEARPDSDIEVVDTIGAGDAFASVMILSLTNDWPLDLTLQRAQRFACKLVGNRGATVSDTAFYQPFLDEWSPRA